MSEPVRHLLALFDSLPDSDKRVAAAELLRRLPVTSGDLPEAALHAVADELFASLDAEEAARVGR